MSESLLLKDDFSSGDFSKWSGMAAGKFDVSVVKKLDNNYAKFTCSAAVHLSIEHSYVYKSLRSLLGKTASAVTAIGDFRIAASGMTEHGHWLHLIEAVSSGGNVLASADVFLDGTTMVWGLSVNPNEEDRFYLFSSPDATSNPLLKRWYTVGLH